MARPFVQYGAEDRLHWTSPLDLLVDLFRWLLILAVTLLIMALLHTQLTERPGHEATEIRSGWLQVNDSPLPPDTQGGQWEAITLPDDWRRNRDRRDVSHAWYRFNIELPEHGPELWAAYIPSLSMNAAVYVNGELVGTGGAFEERVSRNWNRSLYFTVPGPVLRTGDNEVLVRVAGIPEGTGLLAPFYLGENRDLRPYFDARRGLKITLPTVASIATALLAIAALMIYSRRRDEPVYRWYGIGTLIWSVHNLNLVVVDTSVPAVVWDWIWYVSLGWFILMIPPFVHGLLGYERPKVERALFAYGAAGTTVLAGLAVYDHAVFDRVARHGWDTIALGIGVYPTFLMAQAVWRNRDIEIQWLLTTGLLIFVLGCRDALVINDLLPRVDGYMIQYSAPLVIAVFGWLLLSRFVRSIGEVEDLNRDLHARIEERTTELQASFERVSSMEREKAIQAERERILRDMHDGVGGSLAAAVAVAESGKVSAADLAETLRESLEELRLTVDSLDIARGDLPGALGNLKSRLRPALDNANPKLHWDCDGLPDAPGFGPESLSDLVRLTREALSNALRHSKADNIWFRARGEPTGDALRLRIEVEDDGVGIESLDRGGHGLNNMRRRAEGLGASFEILSSRSGTRIVLLLPLGTG